MSECPEGTGVATQHLPWTQAPPPARPFRDEQGLGLVHDSDSDPDAQCSVLAGRQTWEKLPRLPLQHRPGLAALLAEAGGFQV